MRLAQFIAETVHLEGSKPLFEKLHEFVNQFGADCLSYHIVMRHLARIELEEGFVLGAFPAAWVQRYRQMNYFAIDPIIAHALVSTKPFHWFEISQHVQLTDAQEAFLKDLGAYGMIDGLAIPVYGPTGSSAYFGVGSTTGALDLPADEILTLQYACNHVDMIHRELSDHADGKNRIKLSARETQVLGLLTRGLSNPAIANELGISDNTVDTLVRRCFNKLDVHDRVSAAVKGVAMGLVLR
jgi:DNA-binding CsgD family transcriptional regulator